MVTGKALLRRARHQYLVTGISSPLSRHQYLITIISSLSLDIRLARHAPPPLHLRDEDPRERGARERRWCGGVGLEPLCRFRVGQYRGDLGVESGEDRCGEPG